MANGQARSRLPQSSAEKVGVSSASGFLGMWTLPGSLPDRSRTLAGVALLGTLAKSARSWL